MKSLMIVLLMAGNLIAQETICEKGKVQLLMQPNQSEECYKKLKFEKSYKYRFCDSGVGFLYNDGQGYPERFYFNDNKWNWRIDTLDYSNNISSTSKMTVDKDLTHFQYQFVEKTYKGQELRSYSCEGEFKKD